MLKSQQENYEILKFRQYLNSDYQMIRDWANQEGWNQGVYDHLAFKQIDKGGFWIGELNGQPITSLCAAQYDDDFAFLGLYIAKPQHRGKGYSLQLWKHVLSKVTAKNIGLQGALAQQKNYVKSGFITHHRTVRHTTFGSNKKFNSQHLINCEDIDFEKLSVYDRLNFPAERKEFLKKWISFPETKAVAFVKQDKIQGYGVLRRSFQGYRVGPLFADTFQIAFQILSNFIGSLSQQDKISLDIPEINLQALKLAQLFKMTPNFQCARMYTNGIPNIPFDKTVYGITTLQFG